MPKKEINLHKIKAKELIKTQGTRVKSDIFIGKIIHDYLIEKKEILLVFNEFRFEGLLKIQDLIIPLINLFTKGTKENVSQFINQDIPSISEETTLYEIIHIMSQQKSPEIIVMNEEQFCGIISARDIIDFFAKNII